MIDVTNYNNMSNLTLLVFNSTLKYTHNMWATGMKIGKRWYAGTSIIWVLTTYTYKYRYKYIIQLFKFQK